MTVVDSIRKAKIAIESSIQEETWKRPTSYMFRSVGDMLQGGSLLIGMILIWGFGSYSQPIPPEVAWVFLMFPVGRLLTCVPMLMRWSGD